MPTYEYECEACGHRFEKFQSITAKPVRTCPACSERAVKRLLGTGGALIFKGSGFYATDYRSKAYESAAKKESGAGASDTGKREPESETKADTTADTTAAKKD